MWLNFKIAVFYGAPAAALLAVFALLVALLLRVRGGRLRPGRAAALFLWAWLAPAAALLLIVVAGELAGYWSSTVTRYHWDWRRLISLLHALLPVGGYLAAMVLALHLLLLVLLLQLRGSRKG